jgi:mono/diheme cytochrome c family protein
MRAHAALWVVVFWLALPVHAMPPAAGGTPAALPEIPDRLMTPEMIDAGRLLFSQKNCTQCHGVGGTGGVKLVGNTLDPLAAFLTISNGRTRGAMRMPMWKGILSEDEIWQLSAYVMSLK